MGRIHKRGDIYWIKYYRNGRPYQEATKSTKEKVAKNLPKEREGEIAKGEVPGIHFDKVRFEEIAVDMRQRTIRLDPGETKNEEAGNACVNDELFNEMQGVLSKRRLGCPYVFHPAGQPIRKFEKAWNAACQKVGLKGKLFHDFRRTAARNMIRSGIPERVAMTITGHRTRSVFDRYNIVSDQDLKEAARKHQIFIESQNGYKTVTIEDSEKPKVLSLQNKVVGERRFELPTSWSRTKRATRLRYSPNQFNNDSPGCRPFAGRRDPRIVESPSFF